MLQRHGLGNEWRYSDVLWYRTKVPSSQSGINSTGAGILDAAPQAWEWNCPLTGCHVRKVVTGFVRDVNGAAVSGATVYLFNTSTGLLVDTVTTAGMIPTPWRVLLWAIWQEALIRQELQ